MEIPLNERPTTALPTNPPATRRRWLPLVLAPLALAMLLSLGALGYVLYHQSRILPGVQMAGITLGGLSEAEAAAALEQRLAAYVAAPLTLTAGAQSWQVPAAELGIAYDVPASVEAALAVGRRGAAGERLAAWWPTGRPVTELQPVGQVDQARLLAGLARPLVSLNVPPVDARTRLAPDAGLSITPASAGQAVDLSAVTLALRERALQLSSEPVPLTVRPLAPAVTAEGLAPVKEAADSLLRQPFALELPAEIAARRPDDAARRWEIAPADLSAMLTLTGPDGQTLALDSAALTAYLARLEEEIARPGEPAALSLNEEGALTLTPHVDGLALDGEASVRLINESIAGRRYAATVPVRVVPPAVLAADLEPVRASMERVLERQVSLSAAEVSRSLARKELAALLAVEARPEEPAKAALVADLDAVGAYMRALARQVNKEPRAPTFKYLGGGRIVRASEPVQGRQLEIDPAVASLAGMLVDPAKVEVALPIKTTEAAQLSVDPSQVVLRDVLATGATYYGFSSAERRHNVELATARLNGTLIAPGELFSFNRAVGRVNIASGYKTGYGIILTNGAVQTVPSVGGGICQVATTVFHAAFRAGMPIGERNWHLYWIPTYGQAPSGLTGLDATVDEDYGLDFTFRNTTGNWMVLETSYNGANVRMALRGIDPGWEVKVAAPTVSNVRPADPKPVERPDASLPAGRRVQVESAREGMDVAISRTVARGGQVIDQRTFTSHYEPSQNVTLVGTGGATEAAKPSGGQ